MIEYCPEMPVQDAAEQWICCQIGAREHYAVPRALHRLGKLECLITDTWVLPGNPVGVWRRNLRERFHPELKNASVMAGNASLAAFELHMKVRGLAGWWLTMARNEWFQTMALKRLRTLPDSSRPRVLFCYSYAAKRLLVYARCRGWRTVLGQIDPGPKEERIVAGLQTGNPQVGANWRAAPGHYWSNWREECDLADHILVNSTWSQLALAEEGLHGDKVHVVPLAFEPSAEELTTVKIYPSKFSNDRPMQVLFLGLVNLRKGMGEVLNAVRLLHDQPVHFHIVGTIQIPVPEDLRSHPQITWVGSVPRGVALNCYRKADVFLFPTFSDGFGLTQLEAQAARLPVIASRYCGDVVTDGLNGAILEQPSGEAIANVLKCCLGQPDLLKRWSDHAVSLESFSLARFGGHLTAMTETMKEDEAACKPGASPVTAIVAACDRPDKTIHTIERLQACTPPPAEILVHVDAGNTSMAGLLRKRFPSLCVLESGEALGPGGSRNCLLQAAAHEWVASFDDDSYPMDSDYFTRVETLMRQHPDAAILTAIVSDHGHPAPPAEERACWTVDFAGGGCIYRKSVFKMTAGYVPLRLAFAMEEVDLALRLHAMGARILECCQLRVFHDSDGRHRANDEWVAGAVSNVALHAYLRYPPSRWPLGLLQTLWRGLELAIAGFPKGVLRGWALIPSRCRHHKAWRETVPWQQLRSYRMLRKHPLPAAAATR